MMDLKKQLQTLAACIEIVHHLPGRLRLRLAVDELAARELPLQSLLGAAGDFQKALDSVPGIRSVRLNALARSCIVEYDPHVVPAQAWVDFLNGTSSPIGDALCQAITEKYTEFAHGQA